MYQVFNVATDFSWVVPLMWRSHRRNLDSPKEKITKISKRLGVKTYEA